jgi:hypothetical protein
VRLSEITDAALARETAALERQLSENASAGATSAASIATATAPAAGGIGVGFDPNGDKGIYQGKKKPKKTEGLETTVIRR